VLPSTGGAKPVGQFDFVVAEPGDQVDPSIDGQFIVYAGPGPGGDVDVLLYDIDQRTTRIIGGGAGIQDQPDVYLSTAVYRSTAGPGIFIKTWSTDQVQREPPGGGDGEVSNPVVHLNVAAWERRSQDLGLDVVVTRYRPGGTPYTLQAPGNSSPVGDQHAPAVHDDLVAYVDEGQQGSVWLHDSSRGELNWTQIAAGRASGVSVGWDGSQYVIAVARSASGTDEDIEVYDRTGTKLAGLAVVGPQRNPHIAGDWVAFEDQSTGFSQVVVWRWNPRPGPGEAELAFVPHPSQTQQRLNDLSLALSDEVRVVFEDAASDATGRDIALYRLPVNPLTDDGQPNGYPFSTPGGADCDDPNAVVLASLVLERAEGRPCTGTVRFDAPPPPGREELPVLVCIEAEHVSAAWVLLEGDAIATPSDFDPHTVELEVPSSVEDGRGRLFAALAGKPGARLAVRVLADPDRADDECGDDDHEGDDGDRDHGDDDDRDHDGDRHEDRDRSLDRRHEGDRDGDRHGRDRTHHRPYHGRCRSDGGSERSATSPGAAGGAPAELRFDGGCGGAGGLGSLAAPVLLLLRRRRSRA
jgi:hypothetical protein